MRIVRLRGLAGPVGTTPRFALRRPLCGSEFVGNQREHRPNSANSRLLVTLVAGLVLVPHALPSPARARPEVIRADTSYYSDELVESGSVRDIGPERNYEEVFKRYTYYEVIYDSDERVIRCLEYKRGDVIRTDHYRYAEDGSLAEHRIEVPGKPAESVPLPGSE